MDIMILDTIAALKRGGIRPPEGSVAPPRGFIRALPVVKPAFKK